MNDYELVPEPNGTRFTGKMLSVDGFGGISSVVQEAMGVGQGRWQFRNEEAGNGWKPSAELVRVGSGITISDGLVAYRGRLHDAMATVAQLLRQTPGELPEGTITEGPLLPVRGFHQDIGRGGVPTLETWKEMLRWLFICKYTHLGIYFEDLFPWEKYPDIGAHRGRMTRDDLKEVIDYGDALGIEVFPSMNFAGHMENILAVQPFWKYSDWHWLREGVLDLSNTDARDFAYDLLQEVIDFFPGDYIHIGGDEPWALGRGKGLDHDGTYRGPELYRDHHTRLIEMVKKAGKTPLLWGDMISGSIMMGDMVSNEAKARWATILDDPIWRDTIIANWKYNPKDDAEWFVNEIDLFKSRGMEQLACTGLRNSEGFYPRYNWALHNNQEFLSAARSAELPGFLVTSWGAPCLYSYLNPLILACSAFGVSRESDWKADWCALTGESLELAIARECLGSDIDNTLLREALYRRPAYTSLSQDKRDEALTDLKRVAGKIDGVALPDDLTFMRDLVEVGISIFEGNVQSRDILALASRYAGLWRAERAPEGLDMEIARMWGAAGCYENGLTTDSQGWFSKV